MELTPTGATVQRLGAASLSGEWLVSLTSESADVMYSPLLGSPGEPFAQFCEKASRYIGACLTIVGQPAHRIALVREGFANKTPEELDALSTRLLTRGAPFDQSLFEWDWRAATHIRRTFNEHTEELNTIAALRRVEVTLPGAEPRDKLFISTDINTRPQLPQVRFLADDATVFVRQAQAWHAELEASLQVLVEGH
jgi:hypothetical protein